MAGVELDIDAHTVRLALERLDKDAGSEIRGVVKKATIDLRGRVRANAPVKTGLLASTVRSRTQFNKKVSQGSVTVIGPARRYAWIVEKGSKRHNPFEGRKYVAKSENVVQPSFTRELQDAMSKAIKSAGLGD